MIRARTALGCFLLLCALSAWAQVAVPDLSRRVTDLTGTLNAEQAAALENKLAAFEARKGGQIAVLIVSTTQPEDIAQFGIRVADAWKIGRKKVDDGVILIVAKNDRKLRLEVGYGLEGAIPDAIAKRVIAEVITPYFKAGDFYGGIEAGVSQLVRLIEGEALPAPADKVSGQGGGGFLFFVLGGLFAGLILSAILGRVAGGLVAGLGTGVVAGMVLGFSLMAVMMGGAVFFVVAFGRMGGGGWSGGGRGGFGGGGGSSWGGGGGGFGGGGASGSW